MALVIKFINDATGKEGVGNYKYEVLITEKVELGNKPKWIKLEEGELKDHVRSEGWQGLVDRFSKQVQNKKYEDIAKILLDIRS